ncbi:hypothetical protein LG634_21940 [Streptomyces bambusae]|uniref:hypothetical protein n=1 Tax=Streptomyces bambusae TaxID=1550616 RepID=UPI001CFD5563|nr:hypothetical protein [Streptomyces bambusae]MCB5167477.1 hypothetical protein [Streptomyces bambusae]
MTGRGQQDARHRAMVGAAATAALLSAFALQHANAAQAGSMPPAAGRTVHAAAAAQPALHGSTVVSGSLEGTWPAGLGSPGGRPAGPAPDDPDDGSGAGEGSDADGDTREAGADDSASGASDAPGSGPGGDTPDRPDADQDRPPSGAHLPWLALGAAGALCIGAALLIAARRRA